MKNGQFIQKQARNVLLFMIIERTITGINMIAEDKLNLSKETRHFSTLSLVIILFLLVN